jgi:hypothetical protein
MVLNATFNNISVISWWSVLLVEYSEKTTDLSHQKKKEKKREDVSQFPITSKALWGKIF